MKIILTFAQLLLLVHFSCEEKASLVPTLEIGGPLPKTAVPADHVMIHSADISPGYLIDVSEYDFIWQLMTATT